MYILCNNIPNYLSRYLPTLPIVFPVFQANTSSSFLSRGLYLCHLPQLKLFYHFYLSNHAHLATVFNWYFFHSILSLLIRSDSDVIMISFELLQYFILLLSVLWVFIYLSLLKTFKHLMSLLCSAQTDMGLILCSATNKRDLGPTSSMFKSVSSSINHGNWNLPHTAQCSSVLQILLFAPCSWSSFFSPSAHNVSPESWKFYQKIYLK